MILSRSQPLGELVERRPIRDLVGHHAVDLLPEVEEDEPVWIRFEKAYQVEDAPHALETHEEHRGEHRAGKVALRTAPGLPVRVDYPVYIPEIVALEE